MTTQEGTRNLLCTASWNLVSIHSDDALLDPSASKKNSGGEPRKVRPRWSPLPKCYGLPLWNRVGSNSCPALWQTVHVSRPAAPGVALLMDACVRLVAPPLMVM